MHTLNLRDALEIFEDNLSDIRIACVSNCKDIISSYTPVKEISLEEDWTSDAIHHHVNYLAVHEKLSPILNSIKRIDSYRYFKNNPARADSVTDADIQRAREADADWFIQEAQLGTRRPHKGKCPFHDDKSPSLTLMQSKAKGTLYLKCFVCCDSWDSLGFIQKRDNVGFIQAVKIINN